MIYEMPPVSLLPAAADAAGRTSPYRSLKYGVKSYLICKVNQGNASPVTFSILQGQDVSGTGNKAAGAMPIWLCEDTATSDAFVSQPPAASFTTDATLSEKIVVFEVLPEAVLDVTNAFRSISVRTSASNAANVTDAILHVVNSQPGWSIPSTYSDQA
jgi:hypothetical protein